MNYGLRISLKIGCKTIIINIDSSLRVVFENKIIFLIEIEWNYKLEDVLYFFLLLFLFTALQYPFAFIFCFLRL